MSSLTSVFPKIDINIATLTTIFQKLMLTLIFEKIDVNEAMLTSGFKKIDVIFCIYIITLFSRPLSLPVSV